MPPAVWRGRRLAHAPLATHVSGSVVDGLVGRLGVHRQSEAAVSAQTVPRPPGAPVLSGRGRREMYGPGPQNQSQTGGVGDFRSFTSVVCRVLGEDCSRSDTVSWYRHRVPDLERLSVGRFHSRREARFLPAYPLIRRRPRAAHQSLTRRAGRLHRGRHASPRVPLRRGAGACGDAILR